MKNDRQRTFMMITIPILALFVCFNTIPLIRGVVYSFTNFKGFGKYSWVGFRNYIDLFSDARVGKSYLFTIKLAVVTTVVGYGRRDFSVEHIFCQTFLVRW